MKFTYKSKGSVGDWSENVIDAPDKKAAIEKLDEIYGIERDAKGKQTNPKVVKVEIIKSE